MPSAPDSETDLNHSRKSGAGVGGETGGARPSGIPRLNASQTHELLREAVHHYALPHLLAAHGGATDRWEKGMGETMDAVTMQPRITNQDVERLLDCIGTTDFHLAEAALTSVATRGHTRAELLLDLLTPAARVLHERWREDRETFAAVTLATGRLQRLIRSASMPPPPPMQATPAGPVLVSCPCDDPRPFEAAVVADFFRSAHWETECQTPRTEQELAVHLGDRTFDLLVIAMGPDANPARGAQLVRSLKKASANPDLRVLLTGPDAGGEAGPWMEADAIALDAAGAVRTARDLLISRVA